MKQNDDAVRRCSSGAAQVAASSQVLNIINLLGGRANIVDVDACMTRLRVTVKMLKSR